CGASEVTLHLVTALRAERRGEVGAALAAYRQARQLADHQGDRTRLAESLAGIARSQRALGRGNEALEASRQVLAILEEVRPTVLREDLRTAYFSTAQDHFDLHIDLLVELGEDAEAWATAERARAQALRDLLVESGAGLRRSADPTLVERERALQRRLNVLEGKRSSSMQAPSRERLHALRREIDALVEDLERVRGEIRSRSPAYAALTAPSGLTVSRVQRDVLDPRTVLLEYRLGEERSWLWAITRDSFDSYALPPRQEIEAVAREAVRWTRSLRWSGTNPPPLCELSRLVLGPVAELLEGRALVVVADGGLEEVSFAALPSPGEPVDCAEAAPLVASHEVVHLPSVAALATQRRLLAERQPAPGWLAMVADPVYGPDDERLRSATGARPASYDTSSRPPGQPPPRFERLLHSGAESEAVLRTLPKGRVFVARGLDASKETVTGSSLEGYRIVHFATHGVLHADLPLLSFLALSGRTPGGQPADGFLYAHEIYDLEIPAELVVLSACDTALGRQVRGEGLVSGLPRAFHYAGATRVLVSLWPVQDRSTRDLMELFYQGLVGQGLPPGRALQEAQRALWRDGRPPHQWAGFVLQGDWRPLPPFRP
ncbi:MAG TPA: CHAT domain-containing protein, partial [Thermoanaerobaculia bacterium]